MLIYEKCLLNQQGNRWKQEMLPKSLLSIKGMSCNQTLLVHQDITKKTTFYEREITQVKRKDRIMLLIF